MIFELAVFDFKTAVKANMANVDRIELCTDYSVGGISPDFNVVENVLDKVNINVFVMIRCRQGDFIYNNTETEKMIKYLEICKSLNVSGFVFGALDCRNNVDVRICKKIVENAHPLPVTFHRAFDITEELYKSAETIIECGFRRILTSGSKRSAYNGRFIIKDLIERYGNEIIFVPGGSIRKNNYSEIVNFTKALEIHSSKILF